MTNCNYALRWLLLRRQNFPDIFGIKARERWRERNEEG